MRYACPECKNFNFCADCEDKVRHEHHFLKIRPSTDDLEESKVQTVPKKYEDKGQIDQIVSNFKEKCGLQDQVEKTEQNQPVWNLNA